MDLFEYFEVTKVEAEGTSRLKDPVIREFPLRIVVNDEEVVTLVCSPEYLEELAVGYLYNQGILKTKGELTGLKYEGDLVRLTLKGVNFNPRQLEHRVLTSGCGKSMIFTDLNGQGLKKVREEFMIAPEVIRDCIKTLKQKSDLFKKTGGVHAALLQEISPFREDRENPVNDNKKRELLQLFREDIGRHNAVDKIAGHLLIEGIKPGRKILLISGRVSAEILLKTVRMSIPIIISPSAPTDLAVRLAYRLGVTLIGFARGKRMNIYCHSGRIITGINNK